MKMGREKYYLDMEEREQSSCGSLVAEGKQELCGRGEMHWLQFGPCDTIRLPLFAKALDEVHEVDASD